MRCSVSFTQLCPSTSFHHAVGTPLYAIGVNFKDTKAHIPPETGFALATKRKGNQQRQPQRQAPNATYIPLGIGFAFATQRKEIYTKKIKCTYFAFWWNIGLKSGASGWKSFWQRIPHNSDYSYFKFQVSIFNS